MQEPTHSLTVGGAWEEQRAGGVALKIKIVKFGFKIALLSGEIR